MTNTDIETFFAVLQHGTLTAATEALFITQSTLSSRIQTLEHEVGAPLFLRGKGVRHIELTEAGRRFIPLAQRWQGLLGETRNLAASTSRESLRIGAVFSLNQYILSSVYRRFLARDLPVSLEVETLQGFGYDGAEAVARNELDMALLDDNAIHNERLDCTPIMQEEYMLACAPNMDYPDPVSPDQLDVANELCISWRRAVSSWRDHWFGLNAKSLFSCDSMQMVEVFLPRQDIWAVIPIAAAEALRCEGKARVCHFTNPPADRVSYLVTRTGEERSHAAQCFIDDLYAEIRLLRGVRVLV